MSVWAGGTLASHSTASVHYAHTSGRMLCHAVQHLDAAARAHRGTELDARLAEGLPGGWVGGGEDKMIHMEGRSLAEGLSPEGRRSGGAREDAVRGGAPDEGIELGSS